MTFPDGEAKEGLFDNNVFAREIPKDKLSSKILKIIEIVEERQKIPSIVLQPGSPSRSAAKKLMSQAVEYLSPSKRDGMIIRKQVSTA
jgi:hypothetical protein